MYEYSIVLCCSAINPFAFEIYITLFVCLFVASFICLPTLKELHCISHPLYELIVICPSSILHHKEQRKKISTTAFTLNHQSSVGAKSFHLLWSLFFVWHIAFVSKEPKNLREGDNGRRPFVIWDICLLLLIEDDDYLMHQINNKY